MSQVAAIAERVGGSRLAPGERAATRTSGSAMGTPCTYQRWVTVATKIAAEVVRLAGGVVRSVRDAPTGSRYVECRLYGERVVVRLADHRSWYVGNRRRVFSVRWRASARLAELPRWLESFMAERAALRHAAELAITPSASRERVSERDQATGAAAGVCAASVSAEGIRTPAEPCPPRKTASVVW